SARHQQTRRHVLTHDVDSRRAFGAAASEEPPGSGRGLASATCESTQSEYRCCCSGEQKCSYRVGFTGTWPRLPRRLPFNTSCRGVSAEVYKPTLATNS